MTNTKELKRKIRESGLKIGFIAEKLDVSYHWLNKKINNEIPFKAYEIQILCEVLSISDLEEKEAIFFAHDVEEISTK